MIIPESALLIVTLLTLAAVFIAFCLEKFEAYLVALTAMCFLLIVGAISTNDMLSVFSNSAPLTIACMFIISGALEQTGVIDKISDLLLKVSSKSKYIGILLMMVFAVTASAFMNNTPVVVILTPVFIKLAERLNDYPSKYLIPLSYAAILGGTFTLIGTSTNILVNSVAQEYGQQPFSMFEITQTAMFMAAFGLIFLALFGKFLLPERLPAKKDLLETKDIKRYLSEIIIPVNSPLINKSLNEIQLTDTEDYEVIDIVRKDSGARMNVDNQFNYPSAVFQFDANGQPNLISSFRDIKLQAGDRLFLKLNKNEMMALRKFISSELSGQEQEMENILPIREVEIVEGIVPEHSKYIDRRIRDLRLRRTYGCYVVAIHREAKIITSNLSNVEVREGDSLLIEGPKENLSRLFENEQIWSTTKLNNTGRLNIKSAIVLSALALIVTLSASGVMPIAGLAMIGAVAVMITGCITPQKAYSAIDWRILLLIFAMLGIGKAMDNSGAAKLFVDFVIEYIDELGPVVLLACVYLLTSVLTEFITNNAIAIILTPLVINVASSMGYEVRPFIVAIMLAASASLATPIGYQTNTFVYGAGGYKFKDFLIIGLPMNIVMFVAAIVVIPMVWDF